MFIIALRGHHFVLTEHTQKNNCICYQIRGSTPNICQPAAVVIGVYWMILALEDTQLYSAP